MKILIIGANAALAKDAIPILAQDNSIITGGKSGCDIYCDITKAVDIPSDIDIVINFAAAFGGLGDEEIIEAQQVNARGMLNICIAAKKAGSPHIINISSIFALANDKSPNYSIYAVTKKNGEELAQFYCGVNKIPLTILRPSRVYGNNYSFAKHQPFFYQLIDKARKGEDIVIYGKHDPIRNYIHSQDLAHVIDLVAKKSVEGSYNCVHPSNTSYLQIADTALDVFSSGGKVTFDDTKPDIPDDDFPKDPYVYEKIGYSPEISIKQAIAWIAQHEEEK